jgi:hypothetical protein
LESKELFEDKTGGLFCEMPKHKNLDTLSEFREVIWLLDHWHINSKHQLGVINIF